MIIEKSMKKRIQLLFMSLLAWFLLGAFMYSTFYSTFCCTPAISALSSTPFLIEDGALKVAAAKGNILCNFAKPEISTNKEIDGALKKVVSHLNKNPHKYLVVTGRHENKELEKTKAENLGLDRSSFFREKLEKMGAKPRQVLTKGQEFNDLNFKDNKCSSCLQYEFYNHQTNIVDGSAFKATAAGGLLFAHSNHKTVEPISDEIKGSLSKTVDYLKKNKKKSLTINGLYKSDEKNSSMMSDLGKARANTVRKMLIDMGASSKQLLTTSTLKEGSLFNENNLYDGVNFSFSGSKSTGTTAAPAAPSSSLKEGQLLYFETSQQKINLSSEQRVFFTNLIDHLSKNPSAKVNIIGHTDNKGIEAQNQRLGRKRAEFVRDYLIENGSISKKQISTSSKGQNNPITTNDTDEGRAKNRRVEVVLQ